MQRFTVDDLKARGFRKNRNIPGFVGYCGYCGRYRPIDWWAAPTIEGERGGDVCVCAYCGTLDRRDEGFVRRHPVHPHDAQWVRRNFPLHLVLGKKPGDTVNQKGVWSPENRARKPVALHDTAGVKK